jgi:AraC family transcriptional activator of tynA and feaB
MKVEYLSSALAADRHRAWERFIDEAFGAVDMNITDAKTFNGEIRRVSLGELELNEVVSDFEIAKRTNGHIARDRKEYFMLLLLRSGKLNIEQGSRKCSLSPGTFGLLDLNMPYIYSHDQRTDVLGVKIPSGILCSRLRDPHRFGATARTGRTGAGRITADFLSSFAGQLPELSEDIACRYASRIVDLVGVLLEAGDDDVPIDQAIVRTTIYGRCAAFIENHIADPDLSPETIAAVAGISVRYLHKIFHRSGESVGDFIRHMRLKRSYDELTDATKKNMLVKEIAFRGGFRSQAHFAKVIRKSYGASPSTLRQIARTRQ